MLMSRTAPTFRSPRKKAPSSLLVREGGKRFDGNAALELSYDPVSGDSPFNVVASDPSIFPAWIKSPVI